MFPIIPGCCRVCRAKVPPPRRTFCGGDCLAEYLARTTNVGLRRAVWQRDKGVCRVCRLDCTHLETAVRRLTKAGGGREVGRQVRAALGVQEPFRKTFWDADHVRPVREGGGSCGLSNVQTLCLWCHRNKNAAAEAVKAGRPVASRPSGADVAERVADLYPALAAALSGASHVGRDGVGVGGRGAVRPPPARGRAAGRPGVDPGGRHPGGLLTPAPAQTVAPGHNGE